MFFPGFFGWILSELFRDFHTVDGTNPANQLRSVLHPTIRTVLYIPTGAGFLPSTGPFHTQGPSPLRKFPRFSANSFLWPGDCEPRLLANDKTIQFLSTWKFQEVTKWLVLGYIGVYWGYNPLTNLLPTSWDILVPLWQELEIPFALASCLHLHDCKYIVIFYCILDQEELCVCFFLG